MTKGARSTKTATVESWRELRGKTVELWAHMPLMSFWKPKRRRWRLLPFARLHRFL